VLARFDRWTGEADIANGTMKVQQDTVQRGSRTASAGGTVTLANPPKISFAQSKAAAATKR
jgi:hypothetical protein